jgi:hypothetical protein
VNKISKTQRDQLIGIAAGTVVLMGILWYVGVTAKQEELSKTEKNTAQMRDTLKRAEGTMRKGEEIAEKLEARTQLLDKTRIVAGAGPGCLRLDYQHDQPVHPVPQRRQHLPLLPAGSERLGIIPEFPYKWATFHLEGTGYYHDWANSSPTWRTIFPVSGCRTWK